MYSTILSMASIMISTTQGALVAGVVQPDLVELQMATQWMHEAFSLPGAKPPVPAHIKVIENHDPVHIDRRLNGPLNINSVRYDEGLYVHAHSNLQISLPQGADRFTAWVGVHSNEQTSGGRGSVQFIVEVEGKELYSSEIMHEGDSAVFIDVDLGGARQFSLIVGDGDDGIAHDQGVWAEPTLTLEDGTLQQVNRLPLDTERAALESRLPFSFRYGGVPSESILGTWPMEVRDPIHIAQGVSQQDLVWQAPDSGLLVRCEVTRYENFPMIEWVVWFENTGEEVTPLLDHIYAIDSAIATTAGVTHPVLHHNRGTLVQANDFEPFTTELSPGAALRFEPPQGRPTAAHWPYYNLTLPDKGGMILAVGWPGTWFSTFNRTDEHRLQFQAGQATTHFVLEPGEKVRTPRMVVQFWQGGNHWRAQNIWRQWMLAHNTPKPGGEIPRPLHAACSSHQYFEMVNADEASQMMFVDRYSDHNMPLDYWWMDAGWYPCDGHWTNTGTWEVDTSRFPNGLRAIADHARKQDVKTIVWFEPERVASGTWLDTEKPEWILRTNVGWGLLNLANPEALNWLIDHIDSLIVSEGIDLYRQDFNMDPLPYWLANDPENRKGITENLYVQGYLAYWDALIDRHPDMLIDTCASGGHRLDLETVRRSIPLLRSDYIFEPMGQQGHTYGLAAWLPLYGTGVNRTDPYGFRSQMCPTINTCYDMRPEDADFTEAAAEVALWRSLGKYYYGDFYRLSTYSIDGSGIMAWQFNRLEQGDGMIQVFRHADAIYRALDLRLFGLDPKAEYACTDVDTQDTLVLSGKVLMGLGLPVELNKPETALVITYEKL